MQQQAEQRTKALHQLHGALLMRPQEPGDEHFVLDSWKKSHRAPDVRMSREYIAEMDRRIEMALTHPRSRVLIAASPVRAEHIVGWLAYADTQPPVVHWGYVRHPYRSQPTSDVGVLWAMLSYAGISRGSPLLYTFRGEGRRAWRVSALADKFESEYLPLEEFAESG